MGEQKDYLRSRLTKDIDKQIAQFTASVSYDIRLYQEDIAGSVAHVKMLARQGIIKQSESEMIIEGLNTICSEIESGSFIFKEELEDIHMNIENRLFELIGDTAGLLHTARSRNDQIALDIRMYIKSVVKSTIAGIKGLQNALLVLAENNGHIIMPGYTHMQKAQPVLFAHHLLAYFEMLQRDIERLISCHKTTDVLPLGAGALAGVTFPIDREFVARELNFNKISINSLDTVSDRDFILEYEFASSVLMMHLSRLAEEIIIWNTEEFGFIELDDAFASTSSIMPQKKNPDVAELVRGKSGRVYGHLIALLTTMKGLPLAYNRDLQEDKEGLFDTADTILSSLNAFAGLFRTLNVNSDVMYRAAERSYMVATDIADYLVGKGLPFRQAYVIVGHVVQYALNNKKSFNELELGEYKQFSSLFDNDVYNISVEKSVAARNAIGGTSPEQVQEQINRAKKIAGEESV